MQTGLIAGNAVLAFVFRFQQKDVESLSNYDRFQQKGADSLSVISTGATTPALAG